MHCQTSRAELTSLSPLCRRFLVLGSPSISFCRSLCIFEGLQSSSALRRLNVCIVLLLLRLCFLLKWLLLFGRALVPHFTTFLRHFGTLCSSNGFHDVFAVCTEPQPIRGLWLLQILVLLNRLRGSLDGLLDV